MSAFEMGSRGLQNVSKQPPEKGGRGERRQLGRRSLQRPASIRETASEGWLPQETEFPLTEDVRLGSRETILAEKTVPSVLRKDYGRIELRGGFRVMVTVPRCKLQRVDDRIGGVGGIEDLAHSNIGTGVSEINPKLKSRWPLRVGHGNQDETMLT